MAGADPARGGGALAGHTSLLAYRRYFYLKIALALCGLSVLAYLLYTPLHGHGGDTWLGYTLGTIGALLICWLAWYGVRKRRFREGGGSMLAWTSAHVYLGLSLIVVGTLHTGFRFGLNVHTLAWLLMLLVIGSGLYGIVLYASMPRRITANRQMTSPDAMRAEIAKLDQTALRLADKIDPQTHEIVARSVSSVQLGGSVWQQLSGRYARRTPGPLDQFLQAKRGELESQALVQAAQAAQVSEAAQAAASEAGRLLAERQARLAQDGRGQGTVAFVANQMFEARRGEHAEALQRLLSAIAQRKVLVERLNRDITQRARLNIWLFVHVPLTAALLAALVAHIVASFYYW